MTTKKELAEQALNAEKDILKEDCSLSRRIREAQENILKLQEENEKLKAQRPSLLADCKDVSKINKRLKKIEEEIELNEDTITGIKKKRKNMKREIYNLKCDAKSAFQDYIKEIIGSLKDDYTKTAIKFADIITEYITLESICNGNSFFVETISHNDIKNIPNLENRDKPLFEHKYYEISKNNSDRIREKYNIPSYTVEQINHND